MTKLFLQKEPLVGTAPKPSPRLKLKKKPDKVARKTPSEIPLSYRSYCFPAKLQAICISLTIALLQFPASTLAQSAPPEPPQSSTEAPPLTSEAPVASFPASLSPGDTVIDSGITHILDFSISRFLKFI